MGRRDKNTKGIAPKVFTNRTWRRLMMTARARVAARRVLLRRLHEEEEGEKE